MGSPLGMPQRVSPEITFKGLEWTVKEQPARVLLLERSPEPVDPRQISVAHACIPAADPTPAEISPKPLSLELRASVGDDPTRLSVAINGLADEAARERRIGLTGEHPYGKDLARESVNHRAHDDGPEERLDGREVHDPDVAGTACAERTATSSGFPGRAWWPGPAKDPLDTRSRSRNVPKLETRESRSLGACRIIQMTVPHIDFRGGFCRLSGTYSGFF